MENACRDVIKTLEGSFDFVLLVDGSGRIVHASQAVCREAGAECAALIGSDLNAIVTGPARDRWSARMEGFRKAMTDAREGKRGLVIFPPVDGSDSIYSISCSYAETENGPLYLFHGNRGANRSKYAEWEKDERIKELTCLYAVAEWIEVSASIKEFFGSLPRYLATGMHYPEHAVVYSIYQGIQYGRKPAGKHVIETTLEVNKQVRGRIVVGYDSDGHLLLPEEQKMLDEIGRMLELALERKDLRERLASKQAEEMEYARRLPSGRRGSARARPCLSPS